MANLEPFATIEDLESFWRTIDNGDRTRAETLLVTASNYLRQIAKNNSTNLNNRIDEDEDGFFGDSVKLAVLNAVKRAMISPVDLPQVDQWSQSASPYSETMKFTNPNNDIFFKNSELKLLGLASISGKSQFGIVRGIR